MFWILFTRVTVFSVTIGRNDSFSGVRSCIALQSYIGGGIWWYPYVEERVVFLKEFCSTSQTGSLTSLVYNSGPNSAGKNPIKMAQTQKIRSGQYDWLDYRVRLYIFRSYSEVFAHINGTKCSGIDHVKNLEDSLWKIWLGTFLNTLPQMQGQLHDSLVWIFLVCAKVIHAVNRLFSTSFWNGLLGARALRCCKSGQAIRNLVDMCTNDIFNYCSYFQVFLKQKRLSFVTILFASTSCYVHKPSRHTTSFQRL